jgi:hypothetical protein
VTALTLAASGAGAGIAAANPGPTGDQGLVGACNMTNTNAEYGMFTISQFAANSPQGELPWVERRHDHCHQQHQPQRRRKLRGVASAASVARSPWNEPQMDGTPGDVRRPCAVLWREAFKQPEIPCHACVAQAVMEAILAVLPELEHLRE